MRRLASAVFLSLVTSASFAGTTQPPHVNSGPTGAGKCAAQIKPEAKLGHGDLCAIGLLAKRCGNLDACFVKCFASGYGRRIGGGCYHLCNYSLYQPWSLPVGTTRCYAPGEASQIR